MTQIADNGTLVMRSILLGCALNGTLALRSILLGFALVFCTLSAAQEAADEEMLLGSIDFPTSGSPDAQAQFRLGVLALHSFWYEQAMALPGFDREQPLHVVTVAGRLEEVYERNREHPGALHYLIHVYDTRTFAAMGLRQARVYARIAPASSHALHMPSHIFRHLGMWPEVAASNEDSYRASVAWQEGADRSLQRSLNESQKPQLAPTRNMRPRGSWTSVLAVRKVWPFLGISSSATLITPAVNVPEPPGRT